MQRRKPVAIVEIRVGAELEQLADERERAPVNGIGEARPDGNRHRAVRNTRRIVEGGAECREIAGAERRVDTIELPGLAAVHVDFASARSRFTDVSINFWSVGWCTSSRRLM